MNKNKNLKWILIILAGLAFVLIAGCLVGYMVFFQKRAQVRLSSPLVIIVNPHNQENIGLGELVPVHASARSPGGVRRIEVWVDGSLIDAVDSLKEDAPTRLGINTDWVATTTGRHIVIVRAFSINDIGGQASVNVDVVEGQNHLEPRMLEEGETLEGIAAEYGLSPEGLSDHNPGLDPADMSAGDFVNVPDEGGSVPDEQPALENESPEGETPGFVGNPLDLTIFDYLFDLSGLQIPVSDEPGLLRLDVFSLETYQPFESIHCYVGFADRPHRWYPDEDGDQLTAEYFASGNGTSWQVEEHMAGNMAPGIYWPGNLSLSFSITCVGVQGGGTDALDLGPMSLDIPPDMWDGITRTVRTELGEGGFSISYRVTRSAPVPKGPNLDMARPVNLWINYGGGYLTWDYSPEEGDDQIDGFLVFLNDTLVLEEDPSSNRTRLSDPWLYPPCGEEYEFAVVAYISPYDEGDHSVPRQESDEDYQDDRVVISGGEPGTADCRRSYYITYNSLSTGDIPEDPADWPAVNWDHGLGPIHGNFYTADTNRFFQFWRFVPNNEYSADRIMTENGQSPTFRISFNEDDEEEFWWGFRINDEDESGYELVCEGSQIVLYSWFERIGYYEGYIVSEDSGERCRLDYTIHTAEGGSAGTGGSNLPLPQISVEDFTIESTSGQLQVHVRNIGLAAWSSHDLDVRITNHDGELIGNMLASDFYLAVGDTYILQTAQVVPDPPLDVCAIIDPENKVLELYEYAGAHTINQTCAPRPDLSINNVQYDPDGDRLVVAVNNNGGLNLTGVGDLDQQDLDMQIELADGSILTHRVNDVSMGRFDNYLYVWSDMGAGVRESMFDGYTVSVDPENNIGEINEENNQFQVLPGAEIGISWVETRLRVVPLRNADTCHIWSPQDQTVFVTVYVESDYEGYSVGDWSFTQDMTNTIHYVEHDWDTFHSTFQIYGDQRLTMIFRGEVDNEDMGTGSATYEAEDDWGYSADPTNFPVTYPPSIQRPCQSAWNVYMDIYIPYRD